MPQLVCFFRPGFSCTLSIFDHIHPKLADSMHGGAKDGDTINYAYFKFGSPVVVIDHPTM